MALDERYRLALHEALAPLAGEEAIVEMLAQFPSKAGDEPVTRDYLDLRLAELRLGTSEPQRDLSNRLVTWMVSLAAVNAAVSLALSQLG